MFDAKDLSVPFGTRHCSSRRARMPAGFVSMRVMLLERKVKKKEKEKRNRAKKKKKGQTKYHYYTEY